MAHGNAIATIGWLAYLFTPFGVVRLTGRMVDLWKEKSRLSVQFRIDKRPLAHDSSFLLLSISCDRFPILRHPHFSKKIIL